MSPVSASPFTLLELLRRGVRVRKGNLLSVNSVGLGSSRAALWPGWGSVMRQEGHYLIHRDLSMALQLQGGAALKTADRTPLENHQPPQEVSYQERQRWESSGPSRTVEIDGEKQQGKLNKADTSCWVCLVNCFASTWGTIVRGCQGIFSRGWGGEAAQGRD